MILIILYFMCILIGFNISYSLQLCLLTNQLRGVRTRRFITVFTKARHRPLSWANLIHSTSQQPNSLRYILIPSSIYASIFQVVSFLQAFSPKPVHFLLTLTLYALLLQSNALHYRIVCVMLEILNFHCLKMANICRLCFFKLHIPVMHQQKC
jgi:hypothetical protein